MKKEKSQNNKTILEIKENADFQEKISVEISGIKFQTLGIT